MLKESHYGYWSSSARFVLVLAGVTIGLGSVTRLPYQLANSGGSAFLLVYAIALGFISWPMVTAELLTGRWARADAVSGMRRLAVTAGSTRAWAQAGRVALIAGILILSY